MSVPRRLQQIYLPTLPKSPGGFRPALILAAVVATGCPKPPTTIDPPPPRPHAGVALAVAVADPADRDLARQLARSWAARSGAAVTVLDDPYDGTADVALIPPAELGRWAVAGRLAQVPPALKDPTHPYRWDDVLPIYTIRLTNWDGRTHALPVAAEGMVLAYRTDLFDGKDGRPAEPPATWDELVAAATALGGGGPSLPPVPAAADRLLAEFFAAAACYDRPAVGRLQAGGLITKDFFAFQFDPATGDPRLNAPAFAHVARLFQQMHPLRSRQPDPAAAFRAGEAKVGVLSLAELGRVGPEVAEKLGVAPLPGSRMTFDAKGEPRPLDTVNRVPYLGWGGRVGVVSAAGPAREAAWDFLADAGLPDRTALDLLADRRWGPGPGRPAGWSGTARARWYAYGLSPPETERLTTALRDNLGLGVQNYRIRLRTPDHADLDRSLDATLRAMLTTRQDPTEAMAKANAEWRTLIDRRPRAEWLKWADKSLGF